VSGSNLEKSMIAYRLVHPETGVPPVFGKARLREQITETKQKNLKFPNNKKIGGNMRVISYLMVIAVLLIGLVGCDKSNPVENKNTIPGIEPELAENYAFELYIPTDLEGYEFEEIEYKDDMVAAYPVEQFISLDGKVDSRGLYAYEIVADDGYSSRGSGRDIKWEEFRGGYYLPSEKNRTYYPEGTTKWSVKGAEKFNLYRAIEVIAPNHDDIVLYEVDAMEQIQSLHPEIYTGKVIPLKNFVSSYITKKPEDFDYKLATVDEMIVEFTWEQLQEGYWSVDADRAFFPNIEDIKAIKYLVSIELYAK